MFGPGYGKFKAPPLVDNKFSTFPLVELDVGGKFAGLFRLPTLILNLRFDEFLDVTDPEGTYILLGCGGFPSSEAVEDVSIASFSFAFLDD